MEIIGWYMMDMLERSQSLNREALLRLVAFAFRNSNLTRERGFETTTQGEIK
jgi:hypothetical protein